MKGQMQQTPLSISSLIDFAERFHPDVEIVSRRVEGDLHRSSFGECAQRARQAANALDELGIAQGNRVGTLAWNGYRHMELYYGVSGSGRVLHTINPRLHPEQVAYIVNHAEDEAVCFDMTFLPIIKGIAAHCPGVKAWIALCDADALPSDTGLSNLISYEAWIGKHSNSYTWPVLDENDASCLCYTSGTTGNPKGVLYSHRSTVLHAYAGALPDALNLSSRDVVLPVVPMFHVNAWGIPFAAAAVGCKLVFPGPAMDGKSIHDLLESEEVTFAAGVPTVWQMLLSYMADAKVGFSTLRRTVVGGSACPPAMIKRFRDIYDVTVLHAWGMTEMSPLGTVCSLRKHHLKLSPDEQLKILCTQGRPVFGVDLKIVDDEGNALPHDGKAQGELLVRGPWIIQSYFKGEGGDPLVDGWFPTGDVATINPEGYLLITDRSKDVIKSGGEWISSIDVENLAMAHDDVVMAACLGMPHPKWDERPMLAVVKKPGSSLTSAELLAFFVGKISKFQIPDDVVFVDAIPLGATGKMQKVKLREQLAGYTLPGV
jgi:acyl-CoA synthetase (AMP-forming)/AMP-acid ligase II